MLFGCSNNAELRALECFWEDLEEETKEWEKENDEYERKQEEFVFWKWYWFFYNDDVDVDQYLNFCTTEEIPF